MSTPGSGSRDASDPLDAPPPRDLAAGDRYLRATRRGLLFAILIGPAIVLATAVLERDLHAFLEPGPLLLGGTLGVLAIFSGARQMQRVRTLYVHGRALPAVVESDGPDFLAAKATSGTRQVAIRYDPAPGVKHVIYLRSVDLRKGVRLRVLYHEELSLVGIVRASGEIRTAPFEVLPPPADDAV